MSKDESNLVIIFNIPPHFGASDLRRFFTTFVEKEAFECFHFKRRPEDKLVGFSRKSFLEGDNSESGSEIKDAQNCAIARLSRRRDVEAFLEYYHMKHWTDRNHDDLSRRCMAFSLKQSNSPIQVNNLSEFRPPSIAPKGNVGTPSEYFLNAIKQCRLSPKVISKLGLDFLERRRRAFSAVPPPKNVRDEGTTTSFSRKKKGKEVRLCASTATATTSAPFENSKKRKIDASSSGSEKGPKDNNTKQKEKEVLNNSCNTSEDEEDEKKDSDYEEEEWDRHRALHNDVSARRMVDNVDDLADQPGTKERLFEDKMEVTWDKGSSGLVFYTDAQYWKEVENHEEAEDADDWDVDTSEYDNPGTGDLDARTASDMRRSDDFRSGRLIESAFKKPAKSSSRSKQSTKEDHVGNFEKHTKGIGRRLMEGSGWKDGQGLGSKGQGRPTMIDNQGQQGRHGLGFKKSNQRPGTSTSSMQHRVTKGPYNLDEEAEEVIRISTIFDEKS